MSNRSNARKNRNKYKTLRRIGFFKIFVMDYPNANGVAEEYSNIWGTELKHAEEAIGDGEQFYPTIEPQATSHMEHHLALMCAVLGVSRENLNIKSPVLFASSVKNSVDRVLNPTTEPKEEELFPLCLWPIKIEAMVQKAKHQLRENRRERIIETAKIMGETIEVDSFLLGDNLQVFRQREDMWNMEAVEIDTPEWCIVMLALCRLPEAIEHLKGKGFTPIHVISSSLNSITEVKYTTDTYYIYDNLNDKDIEAFKPTHFSESYWNSKEQTPSTIQKIGEQVGESIERFNASNVTIHQVNPNLPDDK